MNLPPLFFPHNTHWEQPALVPDEKACALLWNKHGMLPHIRDHSRAVAEVATDIARRATALGLLNAAAVNMVRAAALLHDIAKTYCIHYGGAHAQLGAAWVREDTGNPVLAQAVLFHVSWPWESGKLAPLQDPLRLPLIISYADKRVRHAAIVTLDERFDDLLNRYGHTDEHRASILRNLDHARQLEHALERTLSTHLGAL